MNTKDCHGGRTSFVVQLCSSSHIRWCVHRARVVSRSHTHSHWLERTPHPEAMRGPTRDPQGPAGLQHPRTTGSLRVLRGPSSRPLRAQGPGEPKQPSMVATVPARAGPKVTLPRWTCAMPRIRARRLALASRHADATDAAPEAGAVP